MVAKSTKKPAKKMAVKKSTMRDLEVRPGKSGGIKGGAPKNPPGPTNLTCQP